MSDAIDTGQIENLPTDAQGRIDRLRTRFRNVHSGKTKLYHRRDVLIAHMMELAHMANDLAVNPDALCGDLRGLMAFERGDVPQDEAKPRKAPLVALVSSLTGLVRR